MEIILLQLIVLLFSAILHEVAHGYVAERLGDPTARLLGRLTLDPRRHIDPFMTILLPLMLILGGSPVILGGAKPVPVDPFNLKDGRKDIALVSLAGPATNILLAIIATLLFRLTLVTVGNSPLLEFFFIVVRMNLILAIFNLLPIPPLDGSKIFSLLLPEKYAAAYLSLGSIGIFILFFLLVFPIGGFSLDVLIASLYNSAAGLLGF